MLQISLLFKKFTKLHGQISREFLGLRIQNFQGIVFTQTETYGEIFKLVWLRCIDDVFLIWTHSEEKLKEFMRELNSFDSNINPLNASVALI